MAIFTPKNYQQIYNSMEAYLVASGSGFTNFNVGSRVRTLLEAVALTSGQSNYIFYKGLLNAIPISLYEGFKFTKNPGDTAGGNVELGLTEAVGSDTLYESAIKITANGNDYETTSPFIILSGETKNSNVIPFITSTVFAQGNWNAITNTPAIPAASPTNNGWYYYITHADADPNNNTEIDGISDWDVGDLIISNGSAWYKATQTDVPILSTDIGSNQNLSVGDIDTQNGFGSFADDYDLDYAKNNVAISGGTDEESDEARKDRFFEYVNGLTKTNVPGILGAALGVTGVKSAYLLENYPTNGWLTLYIDDGTGSSNPTLFALVRKTILGDAGDMSNFPGYRAAGIKLQVIPPNLLTTDLEVTVDIDEDTLASASDIVNLAQTAIESYINNLSLGYDIVLTEITTAVQNAHPDILDVDIDAITVNSVGQPIDNVTVDFDEIAKSGTMTMNYNLIPRT